MLMSVRWLSVLVLGSLFIAVSFNNCSDVEFNKVTANSPSGNGGDGGPNVDNTTPPVVNPPKCEPGANCNVNPPGTIPVAKSTTITVPPVLNKVDLLIVFDNSGSMKEDNLAMAQRLGGLVDILENSGTDWQMCYVTTNATSNFSLGGKNQVPGKIIDWWKKDGLLTMSSGFKVLNSSIPKVDIQKYFNDTASVLGGDGTSNEQAINSSRLALGDASNSNCLRADAAKAVLIVSDEDEKSCGGRCQDASGTSNWTQADIRAQYVALTAEDSQQGLIDLVKTKFPDKPFTASAIVIKPSSDACWATQDAQAPAFYGIEYSKLVGMTGGILGDICAANYAPSLQTIAMRIESSLSSISLECVPVASPAPVFTFTPAANAQPYTLAGDKVLFSPAVAAGTVVKVDYTCLK